MKEVKLTELKKYLMLNFTVLILLNPLINIVLMFVLDFRGSVLKKTIPLILFSLIFYAAAILVYNSWTGRLQRRISLFLAGKLTRDEKEERWGKRLPYKVPVLFCSPMLFGAVSLTIIAYIVGAILNPVQLAFFLTKDILLAISLTFFHYYRYKIIVYPLSNFVNLPSLSIFEKLLAPIISFTVIVFIFVGFGIYSVNVNRAIEFNKYSTEEQGHRSVLEINRLISEINVELYSYLNTVNLSGISANEAYSLSKRLYNSRFNRDIETLFIANLAGDGYTSSGTSSNISDRDYFKRAISEKKVVWSDIVTSKATGSSVIVCLVPYVVDGRVTGAIGATVNLKSVIEVLKKASKSEETRFVMMNSEGRIIFDPKDKLTGKVFGVDMKETRGRDFSIFLKGQAHEFYKYTIEKAPVLLWKSPLGFTGNYIVSITDEKLLMGKANLIIVNIIFVILLIDFLIIFIIYKTGKSFSLPIQDTIKLFDKLAEGHISASIDAYLPDEFGDMIKKVKRFQSKVKKVLEITMTSSNQLAASAVELSSTSSSLADGAQSQAAAVEEATASLEEISASNESIADNSLAQSDHAKKTYMLIEELGKAIETINSDAVTTLNVANDMTGEAVKGNELMQNTIKGMNSLDDNSRKIAEMILFISDISDKVNLLALNAAIEAARAGEHGRGFAVVADEIGKLAEQTAESAKGITNLVDKGVNSARQGIQDINLTSEALDKIISYINNTKDLVQKIAKATEVQTRAGDEVTQATKIVMEMAKNISNSTQEQTVTHLEISKTMDQINEQTQQQASGAEEIASSAEEISAQAESMKTQLDFFKL